MPYADAFNAILATSGYQAKVTITLYLLEQPNSKPIGNKLSKTYRLNQETAKAAAGG